jgi:hypothetical protein
MVGNCDTANKPGPTKVVSSPEPCYPTLDEAGFEVQVSSPAGDRLAPCAGCQPDTFALAPRSNVTVTVTATAMPGLQPGQSDDPPVYSEASLNYLTSSSSTMHVTGKVWGSATECTAVSYESGVGVVCIEHTTYTNLSALTEIELDLDPIQVDVTTSIRRDGEELAPVGMSTPPRIDGYSWHSLESDVP